MPSRKMMAACSWSMLAAGGCVCEGFVILGGAASGFSPPATALHRESAWKSVSPYLRRRPVLTVRRCTFDDASPDCASARTRPPADTVDVPSKDLRDSCHRTREPAKRVEVLQRKKRMSRAAAPWRLLNQDFAGWLLLNLVTVLWGSQHAIIKMALDDSTSNTTPAGLNLARFVIAVAVMVPAALSTMGARSQAKTSDSTLSQRSTSEEEEQGNVVARADVNGVSVWQSGSELGLYTFAGYAMQSIGLQYTTASRSAFLLYLNVKLVPLFGLLLYGRSVSTRAWMNVAIALAGTALLGYDGGAAPNVGDAWSIGAAAASALFILRLEGAAQAHDAAQLNAVCLTTVSVLCAGWIAVVDAPHFSSFQTLMPEGPALQAAAYLGLVTTALTSYLQSVGQRVIKAENAAIIYAMDPVYAAGFSFFLLDERLGPQGLFGGALLVAAAILNLKLQSDEDVPTAAE